jgi:dihydrolipoamide dehydrogenase
VTTASTPGNGNFDVVVIGAGPGGHVAAARAASLGLRTAVVEKDAALGGTCLHVGCIPTKTLLHAADVYGEFKEAARFGIVAEKVHVDWQKLMSHKTNVIKGLASGVSGLMKARGVQVFQGFGRLAGPSRVVVNGASGNKEIHARHVVIATGGEPRALPFAPFDGSRILSSDHVVSLETLPRSMVVIGGGVIGLEFASVFVRFGCKVTVLEALPTILASADHDVIKELHTALVRQGVAIHTSTKVEAVEPGKDDVSVWAVLPDGTKQVFSAERCLVAIGRKPLIDKLGLETTKVKVDKGHVLVDPLLRTSDETLSAIGDVRPGPYLAHVSSAEGVVAAERIAGKKPEPIDFVKVPSCVYTEPGVAWCGLTEEEARKKGHAVKVGRFNFAANGKASIVLQRRGFIKLVTDAKYGELLGAHIIGPGATDLIAEPAFALKIDATAEDLARTVHAHPTLYEGIMEAAVDAAGLGGSH